MTAWATLLAHLVMIMSLLVDNVWRMLIDFDQIYSWNL